jgi:hypothetical protein
LRRGVSLPVSAALQGLRPESVVLMGKNTMMKRSIREHSKRTGNTEWLVRGPDLHTPGFRANERMHSAVRLHRHAPLTYPLRFAGPG